MVISAVLLKITHLPLTKSTFCYKYMWLEYVAYFLFRCMFYPEVPQFCHLKNGQWEYSQESWEHQLGQMQLCAELCLPWVASALPSPCTHRLLKNFWLHYEIWVLLLDLWRPVWWRGYFLLPHWARQLAVSLWRKGERCVPLIHSCVRAQRRSWW